MSSGNLVFDCFTFFNELELLEIRLAEMSSAVDVFVLVEAPVTFQGKPKPLVFADNRSRFRSYLSRIRHIVVDDMPGGEAAWPREFHQRNAIRRGLEDAPSNAHVLVSDADEIIRPRAVTAARRLNAFCFFAMDLHFYFLDRRHERPWMKAYAAPWAYVREMEDLSEPRMMGDGYFVKHGFDPAHHVIRNSGWHFTYMGGVERMLAKLRAFSHQEEEVVRWQDEAALRREIEAGRWFYDGEPLSAASLRALPVLVRRFPAHYHTIGLLASLPNLRQRLAAFVGVR
ncbi:MAG: N-acetylglucosaminyltransferase [Rhodospirillales bacterium]|nr:N-acetylglucosaminyltransferase [Rhodospirillales bacterium]